MNNKIKDLVKLIPENSNNIEWEKIESSKVRPFLNNIDNWKKVKKDLERLLSNTDFKELNKFQKAVIFYSVLLEGLRKPKFSKNRSLNRDRKLTDEIRNFFWKDLDFSGDEELTQFREAIVLLIKYNKLLKKFRNTDYKEIFKKFNLNKKLIPYLDSKLLLILNNLDNDPIDFEINNDLENDSSNEDSWGEVIIMAGLPASGKDTWINKNYPNLPVISLDEIREEINVLPSADQTKVVKIAKSRANKLLNSKTPFIWNATSLTPELRKKQIDMFKRKGAKVKIDYLETNLTEALKRNNKRDRTVPPKVVKEMVSRLNPPEIYEADEVSWNIT